MSGATGLGLALEGRGPLAAHDAGGPERTGRDMHQLGLRDLWIIYRLQPHGVCLDTRSAVLEPNSPFLLSLAYGLLPRHRRVLTVVLRRQEQGRPQWGFVQFHRRSGLPAMDVLFIAPSLENRSGATWLWKHLLHEGAHVAGTLGAHRLFAHLPANDHAAVEVFRQAGFALYAQDRLYRLDSCRVRPARSAALWSPQEPEDVWGIERLYHEITPAVVQQAEAPHNGRDESTDVPAGRWGAMREGCYVLRQGGRVAGYLRLTRGKRGHWLKMVLHPEVGTLREPLLHEALGLLAEWPERPIFCDVREYEGYLADSLEQCGFRHLMTRQLLVRHTTAPVPVKGTRPAAAHRSAAERVSPLSSQATFLLRRGEGQTPPCSGRGPAPLRRTPGAPAPTPVINTEEV